ncbi:MAG: hypothetical protein JZD40_07225, partial [Sulfolobus sp.]|nr:hypothetical protein [Sulfolobus sp.]
KGYTINNEKLNLTAYVTITDYTYNIYVILTNEGFWPVSYTFNTNLVKTSGSLIDSPCSETLVTVSIAKGYYTLSNLTKARYIDYSPFTITLCPAIILEKNTVILYPFVPHVYYMVILGEQKFNSNSTLPLLSTTFMPLEPGVYTIVVKDVFNQTLILHVNFPTYVGGVVYYSNHGVYLTTALPVKEIELVNGNETKIFKVNYVGPFNGIIFVNVTLNAEGSYWGWSPFGPYFKVLVNNTWVTYNGYYLNEGLNLTYSGIASPN